MELEYYIDGDIVGLLTTGWGTWGGVHVHSATVEMCMWSLAQMHRRLLGNLNFGASPWSLMKRH